MCVSGIMIQSLAQKTGERGLFKTASQTDHPNLNSPTRRYFNMEPVKIASQMISFQKNVFENAFNAASMLQEQTEKMTDSFLEQMTWLPEESKQTISNSLNFYKEARENFKNSVDEGFVRMEEMFASN
jgi:hypothetical protein